jgi:hypothetical protein
MLELDEDGQLMKTKNITHINLFYDDYLTVNIGWFCVVPFLRRLGDALSITGSIRLCISR